MKITKDNIESYVKALTPERKDELLSRAFADLQYNVGFDSVEEIETYLDYEGKTSIETRL